MSPLWFTSVFLGATHAPVPAHPHPSSTALPFFGFLLVVLAFALFAEWLFARHSRWTLLAEKFRARSSPRVPWKACLFLHAEYRVGSIIHVTNYRIGFQRGFWEMLVRYFFPVASLAASGEGLYLKRAPWKWAHVMLLIPWSEIATVEELSQTDFIALTQEGRSGLGARAMKGMLPGAVPRFLDTVAGNVLRIHIAAPDVTLSMPAAALSEARRYFQAKITTTTVEAMPLRR